MTWRTWSLAVSIAVGLTTAACFGPVWFVGALSMLLPLAGIGLARSVSRRRSLRESGNVDMEAFRFTVRMLEGTQFQLERLSPADLGTAKARRLMAELRYLQGVLQTQYRGEEVEMPIMEPFPVCPSCDFMGAHAAELDPSGRAWGRTCWECGHRWTER